MSKRLVEFGIVMLILGLNMLLIPWMFQDKGDKLNFGSDGNLYVGLIFTFIGVIIITIRIIKWFKEDN